MAKSNSADISDIMEYMASLVEEVTSGEQLKLFSAEMAKIMEEKILKGFQAADPNRLTQKELKEIKEFMKSSFSSMGMGTRMSSAVFEKFFKNLAQEIKAGNQVQMDRLTAVLSNLVSTMISTSEGAREGGTGKEYFKPTDDKTGKMMYEAIAKAMGVKLDEATYKILSMFSSYQQEQKKERRKFADSLIEGLAANKFIGGALNDSFRLLGLYGATLIKQIPLIGKFIAPVFYGVMQTLGPLLTQAIVMGIMGGLAQAGGNRLFDVLTGALMFGGAGGKAKGIGRIAQLYKKKGFADATKTLGRFASMKKAKAIKTVASGGAKALALGGALGVSLGAGALGMGAKTALGRAGIIGGSKLLGKSLGKGLAKKVPGLSLAAGIGFGAARVAAGDKGGAVLEVLSGIAGTIPGIGTAISVILDIILFLKDLFGGWKKDSRNYQEKSLKAQEDIKTYEKESWWDKVKGFFAGGNSSGNYSGSSSPNISFGSSGATMVGKAQLLSGKTDSTGHLKKELMTESDWQRAETISATYDSTGAITNLGMMSQKHASQVIASDIANRGNKSFYELVPAKYCDMNSFVTDAKAPDNSGVYMARGTTKKFLEILKNLQAQGFDTSGVKITSGIGTLGSKSGMSRHTYSGSARGHFGTNATVFDITMPKKKGTGQLATAQDLMKAGAQTGTIVEDIGTSNQHAHVVGDYNRTTPATSTPADKPKSVTQTSTPADKPKVDYTQTHSITDKPLVSQASNDTPPLSSATGNRQFSRANQTAMNVSLWGSDKYV